MAVTTSLSGTAALKLKRVKMRDAADHAWRIGAHPSAARIWTSNRDCGMGRLNNDDWGAAPWQTTLES